MRFKKIVFTVLPLHINYTINLEGQPANPIQKGPQPSCSEAMVLSSFGQPQLLFKLSAGVDIAGDDPIGHHSCHGSDVCSFSVWPGPGH